MQKERATVIIKRDGKSEDRLRQAIVDGLVRKEVQQDIEATLHHAEETRRYAEHMEAQASIARRRAEQAQRQIGNLNFQIADMQREAQYKADYYRLAEIAYENERRRAENRRKITMTAALIAAGFGLVIFVDIVIRAIMKVLFG